MTKLEFCEKFVSLHGQPISFADRPYLRSIYESSARNLVLRCSRQTEKTTFLVNTILYEACRTPGLQMLFVLPRIEQAGVFSTTRLLECISQSPLVRRRLLGRPARKLQVRTMTFANGSRLFVRAAYHSGDACRGLSAQLLLIDEFQDIADGSLAVIQETLSHCPNGRTILTGTPKSVDNHLESVFRQSTGHEWVTDCGNCGRGAILDERSLGPRGLLCSGCYAPIDPRRGRWLARNPGSTWGDGFWIGHPMVPWLNYDDILERQKQYGIAQFKNEVLGLSSTTGDCIVTRGELEACCSDTPMVRSRCDMPELSGKCLVAGIDWGGGARSRTCLVIGYMRKNFVFQVVLFERFAPHEDPQRILDQLTRRLVDFKINLVAADGGGNGNVYNRLLVDKLSPFGLIDGLYAIYYSAADQEPRQDGVLVKWTVNRSATIGLAFSRVKKQQILFPRLADCGSFLDEFACEVAEYDDITRAVKHHPETQPDDALHATNYALLLAVKAHQSARAGLY